MSSAKLYVAVGLGGVIGASIRYMIGQMMASGDRFPVATLTVNLIGCLLLSYLLFQPKLRKKIQPIYLTAITTGVLGSFTTFSTVIVETTTLAAAHVQIMLVYSLVTFFGGLLCCYIGYMIATRGIRR